MNKRAGPLLLIGMLGAGVPASAQYSSLSQTPANRRQSTASGAGAAHSVRHRTNLADIRTRRAAFDQKAKRSPAPGSGAGSMRTSPVDDSERTRLLNHRIRQLLAAGSNQAAGANHDPMIYPGGVPAGRMHKVLEGHRLGAEFSEPISIDDIKG